MALCGIAQQEGNAVMIDGARDDLILDNARLVHATSIYTVHVQIYISVESDGA